MGGAGLVLLDQLTQHYDGPGSGVLQAVDHADSALADVAGAAVRSAVDGTIYTVHDTYDEVKDAVEHLIDGSTPSCPSCRFAGEASRSALVVRAERSFGSAPRMPVGTARIRALSRKPRATS